MTGGSGAVASRGFRPICAVHLDSAEGVQEPLLAVGGVTSRVQQVVEAEGRVHESFAKGCAVLRREGQGTIDAVAFPGEVKEGLMDLGHVVLDGGPKFGREGLVPEHKFRDRQFEITGRPRGRSLVLLGLATCHDRPGCGGRIVV